MDYETRFCRRCYAKLDNRLLACPDHWGQLPDDLRDEIRHAYIDHNNKTYEKLIYKADWYWKNVT
jgi:hypothetical protein